MKVRKGKDMPLSKLPSFFTSRTKIVWLLSFPLCWRNWGIAILKYEPLGRPKDIFGSMRDIGEEK